MTRNEFLDTVNDWYELIEFCNDVGCSYCDDVYSEESMNDDINERLTDWAQECTWQELYSRLDDIPSGYDYYRCNDYGDWESLDGMCSAAFAVIQQESLQRIQKEEERFNNFVNLNIPKVLK